jgi:hypothetical protein
MAPVNNHNKNGKKNKEANQPSCQILLLNKNCYVIEYPGFDDKLPALFDPDGTRLSFIGNDIFINAIQGALETFFKYHIYMFTLIIRLVICLVFFLKFVWQ